MILYGASGHGKVVHSICSDKVHCFFDDNESLKIFRRKSVRQYDIAYRVHLPLVITIGDNRIRRTLTEKIGHKFGNVISSSAQIDHTVKIGKGTQIIHRALVQCDTSIGNHCIINSMSSIDHDCIIEDFVHIAPNSTLCGNVSVGEGTLVGAGSVVIPGTIIGKWCVIAAGSVVTKNIPDFSLVAGNPGRIIEQNEPF